MSQQPSQQPFQKPSYEQIDQQLSPVKTELIKEAALAASNFFTYTYGLNNYIAETFPQFSEHTWKARLKLDALRTGKMEIMAIGTFFENGLLKYKSEAMSKNINLLIHILSEKLGQQPQNLYALLQQTDPKRIEHIWITIQHLYIQAEIYNNSVGISNILGTKDPTHMNNALQMAEDALKMANGDKLKAQELLKNYVNSQIEMEQKKAFASMK